MVGPAVYWAFAAEPGSMLNLAAACFIPQPCVPALPALCTSEAWGLSSNWRKLWDQHALHAKWLAPRLTTYPPPPATARLPSL